MSLSLSHTRELERLKDVLVVFFLSANLLFHIYLCGLPPVLEYASAVWNPWLGKDISKLEKIQRKCLKHTRGEVESESLKSRRNRVCKQEGSSKEEKLEHLGGVNEGRKDHGFGLGMI